MKKACTLLSLAILTIATHAQTVAYFGIIHTADSLRIRKQFEKAAVLYDKAMVEANGKLLPKDGYKACLGYTLSNQPDKAFKVLAQLAATPLFRGKKMLLEDEHLNTLRQDTRWNDILQAFKRKDSLARQEKYTLVRVELELIYERDSRLWGELSNAQNQAYPDTAELRRINGYIEAADEENFERVPAILDQYGWLGADVLGLKATDGIWAVMENAGDRPEIRKKYLPLLRKAVEAGTIDPEKLAIMEDWVLTADNKPQRYGTRLKKNDDGIYQPLPIADPKLVDTRRAKMGLQPMKAWLEVVNDNEVKVGVVSQEAANPN